VGTPQGLQGCWVGLHTISGLSGRVVRLNDKVCANVSRPIGASWDAYFGVSRAGHLQLANQSGLPLQRMLTRTGHEAAVWAMVMFSSTICC
jgi:hypothetical protein